MQNIVVQLPYIPITLTTSPKDSRKLNPEPTTFKKTSSRLAAKALPHIPMEIGKILMQSHGLLQPNSEAYNLDKRYILILFCLMTNPSSATCKRYEWLFAADF